MTTTSSKLIQVFDRNARNLVPMASLHTAGGKAAYATERRYRKAIRYLQSRIQRQYAK